MRIRFFLTCFALVSTSFDAVAFESDPSAAKVTATSASNTEQLAVSPGDAPTQETTSTETPAAEALKLGHRALRAFESQQFQEAYHGFAEAESLVHSPVFIVYQARAAEQLGQLIEARNLYREAAHEELTESSPSTWWDAVSEGRARLESIEPRIARLRLRFQGEFRLPLKVLIGSHEEQVQAEVIEWEALPGEYNVRVRDAAGRELVQLWSAKEGQGQVEIAIVFESPPSQSAASRGQVGTERSQRVGSQKWGAYTAFAMGGLGMVLGTVLGSVALAKRNTFLGRCVGTSCLPEDEALRDQARILGDLSTVGFTIGIAGALTGGVLFFAAPSDVVDSSDASDSVRLSTSATAFSQLRTALSQFQVGVSPQGVQVYGRF